MQISKRHLREDVRTEVLQKLYQLVSDVNIPQEAEKFCLLLTSDAERLMIAKRLSIAFMLHKGKSYEAIKRKLKVSSASIANVAQQLEEHKKTLRPILKKIAAEEWADLWAKKIAIFLAKMSRKSKTPSL